MALVARSAGGEAARRGNRVKHVPPPVPQGRAASRAPAGDKSDPAPVASKDPEDLERQVKELTAAKSSLESEVQRLLAQLQESEAKRLASEAQLVDVEKRIEVHICDMDAQLLDKEAKLRDLEAQAAQHKLAALKPPAKSDEATSQFPRRAMAAEADLAAAEAKKSTLQGQLRVMEESVAQLNQTLRENKRKFSKREYELMLEDQRYRNKAAAWLKGNRTLLADTTATLEQTAKALEIEKNFSEERELKVAQWLKDLAQAQERGDQLSKGLREIALATGMGGIFGTVLVGNMPESMLITMTLKEVKELVARCK